MRIVAVNASLLRYRDGGRAKAREEGRCRMCLRPWDVRPPSRTRHHVVPKAWFRTRMRSLAGADWMEMWRLRDCDANIVPLCEPCHQAVEHDELARRMLRKVLGAAEAAFAIQLRGRAWFDRRYPPARPRRRVASAA